MTNDALRMISRRWVAIVCAVGATTVVACMDSPTAAIPRPLRNQGGPDTSLTISYSVGVVTQDSGTFDVVGNKFGVTVSSGRPMTKVSFSFPNALTSQNYTVDSGNFKPFTGYDTTNSAGFGTASAGAYWNEKPGQRVITATVTLKVGGTRTVAETIKVQTPTVNSFNVKVAPVQFGRTTAGQMNTPPTKDTTSVIGFFQSYPGEIFTANVNTPKIGGNFAFMQLLSDSSWEQWTTTGLYYGTTSGKSVMDADTDTAKYDILMASARNPRSGISYMVGALQQGVVIPPSSDSVIDRPGAAYLPSYGNGWPNMMVGFGFKTTFTTYLMFQATDKVGNGAWVALGKVSWSQSTNATYKGPRPASNTSYVNPTNWGATYTPNTGSTIPGTIGNSMPTWSSYYGAMPWK